MLALGFDLILVFSRIPKTLNRSTDVPKKNSF